MRNIFLWHTRKQPQYWGLRRVCAHERLNYTYAETGKRGRAHTSELGKPV